MPTLFSHTALPLCLSTAAGSRLVNARLMAWGVVSAVLPDADVLAFQFGIPYGSQWGHRGVSHSMVFALLWGSLSMLLAARLKASKGLVFAVAFLSVASHSALDAMTSGGKGVALLWPFSMERFFFEFRPIRVSPFAGQFFSHRGLVVLQSEFLWVWLPSLALALLLFALRKALVWR